MQFPSFHSYFIFLDPIIFLHSLFSDMCNLYSSKLKKQIFNVCLLMFSGLDDWGSRVQFSVGRGDFSLHYCVQNGSGAHPASYPIGSRGSFPGG